MISKSHIILFTILVLVAFNYSKVAPGAIQSTISVKSINHIVSTFVPILSYYILNNKTMELDMEESGLGYKVKIDDIHIVSVDGWTTKDIEFLPNTNRVRVLFSGINIQAQIDGEITALWVIKLHLADCNITNLSVQIDVSLDQLDDINWIIIESNKIDFDDIVITTTSSWINYVLKLVHGIIVKMVKRNIPKAEKEIDSLIAEFNTMLINRNDTTFVYEILENTGLNLTTTIPPRLDNETGLLYLYLDGLFYDFKKRTTHISLENTIEPPRYHRSHSEQFWVHDTLLNSLYQSYFEGKIDVDLNQPNITKAIIFLMPELRKKYGKDTDFEIRAEILSTDEQTFTIDHTQGLILGNGAIFKLYVYAKQDKNTTLAVQLDTEITLTVNLTLQDFIVYCQLPGFTVTNSTIIVDNVGLYDRNYDQLFKDLLDLTLNLVNSVLHDGYDIRQLNPNIQFIAGMIQNTTVTPYQLDNFYYAGFKFFTDIPSQLYTLDQQKAIFSL